ncbi:MAG: hypothetical protein ABSC15_02805 [Terriglobales bacterium]
MNHFRVCADTDKERGQRVPEVVEAKPSWVISRENPRTSTDPSVSKIIKSALNSPVEVLGALKVVQVPGMVMFLQQNWKRLPVACDDLSEPHATFIPTRICAVVLRAA